MKSAMSNWRYYFYLIIKQRTQNILYSDLTILNALLSRVHEWYKLPSDQFSSVLDLGCGRFMPFSRFMRNYGKNVVAVDMEYVYELPSVTNWIRSLRYNGFQSFLRDLSADLQQRRVKSKKIVDDLIPPSPGGNITIVRSRAEDLSSIHSSSVDLCFSVSLFEHVSGVERAFSEIRRILKPQGVTIHAINLWGSLNGDHNPFWYDFEHFSPWSHLTKTTSFTLPYGYLNRYTSKEYLYLFEKHFREVHYEWVEIEEKLKNGMALKLLNNTVRSKIYEYNPHIPDNDLLNTMFIVAGKAL